MAYYQQQKLGELPKHHHKDDHRWLNEKLAYLDEETRHKVCNSYSQVYREAEHAEPNENKKSNRARFAANSRLRIFLKKRFAVFNKQ